MSATMGKNILEFGMLHEICMSPFCLTVYILHFVGIIFFDGCQNKFHSFVKKLFNFDKTF